MAVGKISCTADIWSDKCRWSFFGITIHWIARVLATSSLVLMLAILGFHRLRGKHNGKNLARTTIHLLDRAGITTKVNSFIFLISSTEYALLRSDISPSITQRTTRHIYKNFKFFLKHATFRSIARIPV
jgi:hypothetical protein